MSKFRFKMKLQGLEIELEGNREDASLIGRNIGEQVTCSPEFPPLVSWVHPLEMDHAAQPFH